MQGLIHKLLDIESTINSVWAQYNKKTPKLQGKFFLHPTFLNLHSTHIKIFKNALHSENEKLKLEKYILEKEIQNRLLCSKNNKKWNRIKK